MLKESNQGLIIKVIDFLGKEITLRLYKKVYEIQNSPSNIGLPIYEKPENIPTIVQNLAAGTEFKRDKIYNKEGGGNKTPGGVFF